MNEFMQIFISIIVGNIIGYYYAKWKYYGEIDILIWKIKNSNILNTHNNKKNG